MHRERIPFGEILKSLETSDSDRPGLVELYRTRVLPIKTRTIHLLGRKCSAHIIHTLLGFEVQASYKRIHCPDLVTARYLSLFTELGCRIIKLPYDPTVTAALLPSLEDSSRRIRDWVAARYPHRQLQRYVIERLYRMIKSRLQTSSSTPPVPPAGLAMPQQLD